MCCLEVAFRGSIGQCGVGYTGVCLERARECGVSKCPCGSQAVYLASLGGGWCSLGRVSEDEPRATNKTLLELKKTPC